MSTRSYYAVPISQELSILSGDRVSGAAPLVVNCAGTFETAFPFQTDNPSGRQDYYLMYLVRGSLRVRLAKEEMHAGVGTLLLFPPHYHYHYTYTADEPLHYLWVHFSGSHVEHYLRTLALFPLPIARPNGGEKAIIATFDTMFDTFRKNDALRDATLACQLEQLLLILARADLPKPHHPALARSLHYIDTHYAEHIGIETLAAMENLSYSRYHDVFVAEMGCPPRQYITHKRLEQACELLASTNMSVGQIGTQIGYDDPHFFSKVFKKELGLSPLAYRKKN